MIVACAAKFIADSSVAASLDAVGTTKHPLCYGCSTVGRSG
jgi:hypothetical protein